MLLILLPVLSSGERIINDLEFRNLPTYMMALEESDYCSRAWCGPKRAFLMHIKDGTGMDVLRMSRPFNWHLHFGCYPLCGTICCPETADVFSMAPGGFQGPLLAKIRLEPGCSFCSLSYRWQLLDANGTLVYTIGAPPRAARIEPPRALRSEPPSLPLPHSRQQPAVRPQRVLPHL
jgi:Scramblase